jgi:hypothetical protein
MVQGKSDGSEDSDGDSDDFIFFEHKKFLCYKEYIKIKK